MRKIESVQDPKVVFSIYHETLEPISTHEEANCTVQIIDANYFKADQRKIVEKCTQLSEDEQAQLLDVLLKYEVLFDGTLGDWKTSPVKFELKEVMEPYHGKPFPVPKILMDTLKTRSTKISRTWGISLST